MKILFTYEYTFHKFGFGGGQVIALNLMESLSKMGHNVSICCAGYDDSKYSKNKNYNFYFSGKYSKYFSSIQSSFHSLRIIKKIKPDLVCSLTGESFLISNYCKKKNINFCNYICAPTLPIFKLNNPLISLRNIRYNLTHFFQFLGVIQSEFNFSISNYTYNQLIKNWNINDKKVINIGCGVSNSFFNNNKNEKNRIIDVCTVGRIEFNQKPINITAKALKQNSIWSKWVIVGNGHDETKFKTLIKKYGLNKKVKFLGKLNNSEISDLLSKTKVSVLVSTKESFLITAYEAIASKNILIVSDVAQISYDFSSFSSVLILKKNSEKEINKLLNFSLKNYDDLYKNTEDAKNYVLANYTWNKVAKKLIKPFI